MSETDAEFIARMEKWSEAGSDTARLFALARRGAAVRMLTRKEFNLTYFFEARVLAWPRGEKIPEVRVFSDGCTADGYDYFIPLTALGEPPHD